MAESGLQFSDVEELALTELDGHLLSPRRPKLARAEIRLESFDDEGDANAAHLQLGITITDADGGDGTAVFEGLVSYYVKLREGLEMPGGGKAELFVLLWPYLRATMQDHAARFGHARVPLPLHVSVEQLVAGEPDGGSEDLD